MSFSSDQKRRKTHAPGGQFKFNVPAFNIARSMCGLALSSDSLVSKEPAEVTCEECKRRMAGS